MTAHRKAAEPAVDFVRRHIGPSPRDIDAMLESVGVSSLNALMNETLPSSIRQKIPLDLATPLSETAALTHMREIAARNQVFTSLIGQGYSGTILPRSDPAQHPGKSRRGTRPIRRTSRKSAKAAWKLYLTSRP